MQRITLGAIVVEHDHGVPRRVLQVDGDELTEAHELVSTVLLASDDILDRCIQDLEDNPCEVFFDDEFEAYAI